jgi:hypothetical protein
MRTTVQDKLPEEAFVLLCSVSFEGRCVSAPLRISPGRVSRVFVFYNLEFEASSNEKMLAVEKHFGSEKITKVCLSVSDPFRTAETLVEVTRKLSNSYKGHPIVFDVTTFTREQLLVSLRLFGDMCDDLRKFCVVYTTAKSMSSSWLSQGVRDIRPVLGFFGLPSRSKLTHLVVMLGFEIDRARSIIREYDPDLLSVGVGSSLDSISGRLLARNRSFVQELRAGMKQGFYEFEFSLRDPFAAAEQIADHLKSFPGERNVVLAPLNNKLSSLGAGLVGLADCSLQICYAEVLAYNKHHYSVAGKEIIVCPVDWRRIEVESL